MKNGDGPSGGERGEEVGKGTESGANPAAGERGMLMRVGGATECCELDAVLGLASSVLSVSLEGGEGGWSSSSGKLMWKTALRWERGSAPRETNAPGPFSSEKLFEERVRR